MRRRSFLAVATLGGTVGLSGCLEGEVVTDVKTSKRIEAHECWVETIDEVDGSGGISYTVRSEEARFETFYFRNREEYRQYEQAVYGNGEASETPSGGYDGLRAVASKQEDTYEAAVPPDGSRHSLDFDGTHYFVVDNSNYGTVEVPDRTADLPVVIDLEIVKDRF